MHKHAVWANWYQIPQWKVNIQKRHFLPALRVQKSSCSHESLFHRLTFVPSAQRIAHSNSIFHFYPFSGFALLSICIKHALHGTCYSHRSIRDPIEFCCTSRCGCNLRLAQTTDHDRRNELYRVLDTYHSIPLRLLSWIIAVQRPSEWYYPPKKKVVRWCVKWRYLRQDESENVLRKRKFSCQLATFCRRHASFFIDGKSTLWFSSIKVADKGKQWGP